MGARGVQEAAAAFAAACAPDLEPPAEVKIDEADRPIWDRIMDARARGEWSGVDLFHAANLVRCLSDIERISAEVRTEADVITSERGVEVINPKHALVNVLSNRAERLTRLLHLHASVLQPHPEKSIPTRKAEQAARRAVEEGGEADQFPPGFDAADLLARPEWRQ